MNYMAIAVETPKHPRNRDNYKVWYLELSNSGHVTGLGVKTKKQLVESLFKNYRKNGTSNWRAFCKDKEHSSPIEIYDFIAQNMHENTHFGSLPTLSEFQETLNALQMNLELRPVA